jgi:hypothetical protein
MPETVETFRPPTSGGTPARLAVRRESGEVRVERLDANTSALPSSYEAARRRIYALQRPTERAKMYAWCWLKKWRAVVAESGRELPAPWIFADESGVIEFEWHSSSRHLVLTLAEGVFEFSARQSTQGATELEHEGSVSIARVCALLRWVSAP